MITEDIRRKIEKCTTPKQVKKILDAYNIQIVKDNTEDHGAFSIWVDELTRIYKPHKSKYMKVQRWYKTKMEYSGIPTFFPTESYF